MPRKDGFAACSEIRAWEKENKSTPTPIIALSANVMSDVAERCAIAGFSRYVSKPVDFKVLGETIKDLLDTSKNPGLMSDFIHIRGGTK
jgi:CheY-like chemotaxis protein